MKILVTGADGFFGSNIVRVLLDQGHTVRALLQPHRETGTLKGLEIERVIGDVLYPDTLPAAFAGCDAVIHAAGDTSLWPYRSKRVRRINIEGTRHMVAAALASGIRRMVHVGTANTFGFGPRTSPGKEGDDYAAAKYGLDYMDSKYEAHQIVLAAVATQGLPAVIVNPTFMLGAYATGSSTGAIILALLRGNLPGCAGGGRNFINVRDAAHGVAAALTKGQPGECYILGHENLAYTTFFKRVGRVVGVPSPTRTIPGPLLQAFACWEEFRAFRTGQRPTLSRAVARISCDEQCYSAQKAVRTLGLPQHPIEEGIRAYYEWAKGQGLITEKRS